MTEMPIYRGQWVRPVLESSLPHIVVDRDGKQRAPLVQDIYFTNQGTARRWLHERIRDYDKRRRDGVDDPRTWAVRPVKGK